MHCYARISTLCWFFNTQTRFILPSENESHPVGTACSCDLVIKKYWLEIGYLVLAVLNEKKLLPTSCHEFGLGMRLTICRGLGLAYKETWCSPGGEGGGGAKGGGWMVQREKKITTSSGPSNWDVFKGIRMLPGQLYFRYCKFNFRHDTCRHALRQYSKHVVGAQKGSPKHCWRFKRMVSHQRGSIKLLYRKLFHWHS